MRPGPWPLGQEEVAAAILKNVTSIKCVFEQRGGMEGEFRLRKLSHLGGEDRTVTTHRENGCAFKVDLAQCYYSPRLSTERLRIAEAVGGEESVLNMFAGVGPFSIPIAKKRKARVTSCELNEHACRFHVENNGLNKVDGLVDVVNADAMQLPTHSGQEVRQHPDAASFEANEFLPVAPDARGRWRDDTLLPPRPREGRSGGRVDLRAGACRPAASRSELHRSEGQGGRTEVARDGRATSRCGPRTGRFWL